MFYAQGLALLSVTRGTLTPKDSPASPAFPHRLPFPLALFFPPHNQKWDYFVGDFSPTATIILVLERDKVVWLTRYHHSVGRNARSGTGGLVQ